MESPFYDGRGPLLLAVLSAQCVSHTVLYSFRGSLDLFSVSRQWLTGCSLLSPLLGTGVRPLVFDESFGGVTPLQHWPVLLMELWQLTAPTECACVLLPVCFGYLCLTIKMLP